MKAKLTGFVTHEDGKTWYYGNGNTKPTCWMDRMNRSAAESKLRRMNETSAMAGRQLSLF
jgi:hypothetical protein